MTKSASSDHGSLELNKKSSISKIMTVALAALIIVGGFFVGAPSAFAVDTTITSASGGTSISADTVGGSYTTLVGPVIVEGVPSDIKSGTITLSAPTGFAFDSSNPTTVTVTGSDTAGYNINNLPTGTTITTNTTASQISFTITSQSTSAKNTLTWGNIRVRPTSGTTLANGNLTLSSNTKIIISGTTELVLPANVGTLTEVAGALASITISPSSASLTAGGATQTLTATKLDQFGNSVSATLSWTSDNSGFATVDQSGVVTPVASGTAHVTASSGGVTSNASTITVSAGGEQQTQTTPTFNPVAGTVSAGTTITIISGGADNIYYTTDNSTPTISSTNQATTPLVINSAVTIKALAVKTGNTNSAVGSATYTIAQAPNYTTIFGNVKSTLHGQGIETNINDCASVPTGCSNLYFEKTGRGKVTFSASLDLTDSATNTFLQNFGTAMDVSAGSMKFDASTATQLKNAGAQIAIYGLNDLGITSTPNIVVRDDSGVVIVPGSAGYPTLTTRVYTSANNGTVTFSSDHFTSFDAKKVIDTNTGIGYDTIQAAVTAANSGDTINVAAGTYTENLTINKSLTIQGVGDTTIINGTTEATGDNVTIQDLKITNSNPDGAYDWGVKATAGKALTLENVTVDVLHNGVYMRSVSMTPTTIAINNSRIKGFDAIYLLDPAYSIDDTNADVTVNVYNTSLIGATSFSGLYDDMGVVGTDYVDDVHINFTGTSSVANEYTNSATSKERLIWFYYAGNNSVTGTPIYTNAANSAVNAYALFVSSLGYANTVEGQIVGRYVDDAAQFEAALAAASTTPIMFGTDIATTKDSTLNAGVRLIIEHNYSVTIGVGHTLVNNGTIVIEDGATLVNNGTLQSASISGTAKYGQVLTATIVGLINAGTPTYQWRRDGSVIGGATAETYTLASADIGTVITVTAAASNISGTGLITSVGTGVVAKANGPALSGVTTNDVLNTVTGMTTAMEFSTNGTDWTTYNEVTPNLPDLTGVVALQVRVKVTATQEVGAATTFNFTTPTLSSIVITTPATKLIYKVGDTLNISGMAVTGTYNDTSTKIETISGSNVSGFNSSAVTGSQTLTVTFNEQTTTYTISIIKADGPSAPSAPTEASKTSTSITLAVNVPNQFSKDGGEWQDSEIFSGLTASTSYTFTTRVRATSTTNESVASTGTAITTDSLPTLTTPTFSPVAGAVTWGTTVTIVSSGADTIYYTTNGDTPTISSTNQASTPLVINGAVTVKALAVKAGYNDSTIVSAAYTQATSANLTNVALSETPGNYTFAAGTYTYNNVTVVNGISSIIVAPTGSGVITMSLDGGAPTTLTSGVASDAIALTAGAEKTITVITIETGKAAKTYTIKVTRALNSAKAITAFSFSTGPGAIDETNHTIAINVSNDTSVINLIPTIEITGASVNPNTGVGQDFSSPVTYTVTAANSDTQTYIVTVTVLPTDQIPADTDVTVNTTQTEVVVNSSDETTITVPSDVTDATINVDSLTTDNGSTTTAILPAINLNVTTSLSASAVEVEIPTGTVVTAPTGWDGTINVPTVKANSTVTATPDSGKTATVQTVIEVGYGDVKLVFSNAVRILIPGQAGKDVGYSRSGVFTKITDTCSADTQGAGNALAAEGDCKIDVGSDLVIWTKHFTTFATYTQTTNSGGGGGGGYYYTPTPTPAPAGQVLGIVSPHTSGTLFNDNGTIYLVTNGQRRGFRDTAEYLSYGFDFASIDSANSGDATLPTGSILKAMDGTLALDTSDGRTVYLIGSDGIKRGFVSEAVFSALGYRFSQATKINLADYAVGDPIATVSDAHPNGTLVISGQTIWWINNNQRHGFTSMDVFNSYGWTIDKVLNANVSDMSLPEDAVLQSRADAIRQGSWLL